mmetsp:Transcript_24944/g.98496  ORF Transcript_24944/g.98496 Transcript_24944/m.98496 type:complete len:93 (-) Transcript_24944:1654-1932(-)
MIIRQKGETIGKPDTNVGWVAPFSDDHASEHVVIGDLEKKRAIRVLSQKEGSQASRQAEQALVRLCIVHEDPNTSWDTDSKTGLKFFFALVI